MNISVAIVEDNGPLRASLSQLIDSADALVCAGAFATAEELLHHVNECKPHVVLMDIGLPGISGVEAVHRLKETLPSIDVLMLTVYDDDRRIFEAVCAGASGYLLKKTPPDQILQAILDMRRGGAPMTPRIARRVLEMFRETRRAPQLSDTLSAREEEVLNALVEGLSYKMIADRLYISIDTVRSHIKHIYEKLHINSKSQAIALALRSRESR